MTSATLARGEGRARGRARRVWVPAILAVSACGGRTRLDVGPSVDSGGASALESGDATSPRDASFAQDRVVESELDAFADAPPPPFDASGLTTCAACISIACEDQYIQCQQGGACDSAYRCLRSEGSGPEQCYCSVPAAENGPLFALARCLRGAACADGECRALCGAPDAGGPVDPLVAPYCAIAFGAPACMDVPDEGALTPRSSTASCDACVSRSCHGFTDACSTDTDCQFYVTCLSTCGDAECESDCEQAHPTGAASAGALDVCLGGTCGSECNY